MPLLNRARPFMVALAIGATALLAACDEAPTVADADTGPVELRVQVDLLGTATAGVTVEVTAADLPDPLLFNLEIDGGAASGGIVVPAGSDRHLTLRAFDQGGTETHRGTTTLHIREGESETVQVAMDPLQGSVTLEATVGEVFIVLRVPDLPLTTGDTAQIIAHLVTADGDTLPIRPTLGSDDPSLATIDSTGLLTVHHAEINSSVTLFAMYGGIASSHRVRLTSPQYVVEIPLERAYRMIWNSRHAYDGAYIALSAAADAHASNIANGMQYEFAKEPREAIPNSTDHPYYSHLEHNWNAAYSALRLVNHALQRLEGFGTLQDFMGEDVTDRAWALGRFLQGYALGTIAQLYDYGFILDEATFPVSSYERPVHEILAAEDLLPYGDVMADAVARLQEAAEIADTAAFSAPPLNGLHNVDSDLLARLARSHAARFMATVARTPAERDALDWPAIVTLANRGVQSDFTVYVDGRDWSNLGLWAVTAPEGWGNWDLRFAGQADTTGSYETWMATPVAERTPTTIASPDTRFPGAAEGAGSYVLHYTQDPQGGDPPYLYPENGEYNHSPYADRRSWIAGFLATQRGEVVSIDRDELRLLITEGFFRFAPPAHVVAFLNYTRADAGLPPLTEDGVPDAPGCVPRVFDGSEGTPSSRCGTLFDALKYEKRVEVYQTTIGDWFFDSRGWGDLIENTPLHLPLPARVAEALGITPYTYGGEGGECAAGSGCTLHPIDGSGAAPAADLFRSSAPRHSGRIRPVR